MSGSTSRSISSGVVRGRGKVGPWPDTIFTVKPIASGTTMMSQKRIAASRGKRSTGWIVTSAASFGVSTTSKKSCSARISRYSGRYRPACRIIQTGVRSVVSPRAVRRIRSFCRGGNEAIQAQK
jgi:hypothetical protein